jgi:hypothetical protein
LESQHGRVDSVTSRRNDGLLYLQTNPSMRAFITECVACHRLGHDPVKLAESEKHPIGKRNVARYFPEMPLSAEGLCEQCILALGITDPPIPDS